MAKFKSAGSASWSGVEFFPDEKGEITVPREAVDTLKEHGLVLVEGTDHIVPMPSEAASVLSQLEGTIAELKARVRSLEEENIELARDKRALLARVTELEGLNGPATDDKANTDANNPRFGAMTVEQMEAFKAEHGLEVDLTKGSIPVKRSALRESWEAAKKKLRGE